MGVSDVKSKLTGTVGRVRRSRPFIDHMVRAYSRYKADTGDRLAAGVTFFGFLSFFPLLALAFSILGYVLASQPDLINDVTQRVNEYLPGLVKDANNPNGIDVAAIADARRG